MITIKKQKQNNKTFQRFEKVEVKCKIKMQGIILQLNC